MGRSTTPVSIVIFAGIDYHKKFSVIALGDAEGNLVDRQKLVNDEELIRRFFSQYPGLTCTVESCRGYEWFVDLLKEIGLTVHVCNPRQVKLIAQSKKKNDKVDSKTLMELLAKGYLPTCYQASPEERRLREKLRWRVHLVRNATRIKLRIHALLDKENKGLGCPDIFSSRGREYLKTVVLSSCRRELLDKHLELLDSLDEHLGAENTWMKNEVKKSPSALRLKTVPGFGDLSALSYIAEIGDITRFRRAEQVSAFLGLVPSESSSADRRRLGGITKHGSRMLRWLLIEDAWQAIRMCPELGRRFARITRRRGKNVAIVAIARKLAEIAFCVLRDNVPFDTQRLAAGPARSSPLPSRGRCVD